MYKKFYKANLRTKAVAGIRHWSAKRAIKIGILLGLVAFTSTALFLYFNTDIPLTAPITNLTRFNFFVKSPIKTKRSVWGYLPYWNLKSYQPAPELTDLLYFSLAIGGDGRLLTNSAGEPDMGYTRLKSDEFLDIANQLIKDKKRLHLTLIQFNGDDAYAFLNSDQAQTNLEEALDSVLLAYPFGGVNLDVELNGSGSAKLQPKFSAWVHRLRTHLNSRHQDIKLSIATYASAGKGQNIWDLATLSQDVDAFVVMAYDFHRVSSPVAGPVAPLFGGVTYWDSDINSHLKDYLAQVPPHKILLGVPFYGYEWQTTNRDAQSATFPDTGATATYKRVEEILSDKDKLKVKENWNEAALSPYLTYESGGKTYVLYYDNPRSISYKLDYVNELNLGGVAIWALGYEGETRELWEVIGGRI